MLRLCFLAFLISPKVLQAQCPTVDFGADTTICSGTSITLDAGNPGATYLWSDGSTSQQLETFFEGEYWAEVTLNGCTVRDTIYVAQGPVIQADFSYVQTSSCSPFVVDFSESSQACSASIIEWSWDFGDGTTSANRNPSHIYASTGDYLVKLTVKSSKGAIYTAQQIVNVTGSVSPVVNLGSDRNLCFGNELVLNAQNAGANFLWNTGETTQSISVFDGGMYSVAVTVNGCVASDTINITSVPVLWSDFTFQKVSGCTPVKFRFTDNSSACESTITSWYWEFGDGTTSTEQNPEHDFATVAQFNVKLTVTDDNGNSIRRSKRVTVTASSFSVDLGKDTTICFGSTVLLDAGVANATYLWSTGETTRTINAADDGDYFVTVQSSGCTASDTVHVNTSASVLNRWSFTVSDSCLPVNVKFSDSSVAYCGQAVQSWLWDFGDGTFSTEQHPNHDFTTSDTFVVKLTVTTTSGAASTTNKKVAVNNSVHAVNIPSQLKVCTGEQVLVDAGVTSADYTWGPAFGVADIKAQQAMIAPIITTWYYVDVLKCSVNVRDSVLIVVDSVAKPEIWQEENFLTTTKANAYDWYVDGVKIEGARGNRLRIDRQGYYAVKAMNKSGCGRTSVPRFFMPVSGNEKAGNEIRIKCSPNPGKGVFKVIISEVPAGQVPLIVYDRFGRTLLTTRVTGNVTSINLERVSRAVYYVELRMNNKKKILPVVIQ